MRAGGKARRGPGGDAEAADRPTPRVSLATIAREWGRIGATGFGGPPALIAMLHRLCVKERGWISETEFHDGIAAANLLPGPAAIQLGIYCAWRLRGKIGGAVAGVCFALPGLLVILGLSVLFLAGHPPLWLQGAAAGAGAAVAAVAVNAAVGLMPASWKRIGTSRGQRTRWVAYTLIGGAAAATLGPYLVLVLLACGLSETIVRESGRPGRELRSISAVPLAAPTIRPRERSHLPDYSRKLEFVSDAELDAAIVWAASRRPLDISGAAREALDAMGLGRANPGAEGRVAARTQQLVMTRQLKRAPSPEGVQSRSRQTPKGHRRIHLLADEQMAMLGDSATSAVPVRHAGDASPAGARIPATSARPDAQVDGEAAVLVAQLADPAVRRSSQARLRHMGRPAVGPLIKALADESLRRAAETVLVELGQLAAPELSAAMLDGDERIRRAAEETLDRMGL